MVSNISLHPATPAHSHEPLDDRLYRKVFINDLVINGFIGIYDHEKKSPQQIRINVVLWVQESFKPLDDNFDNVVCYERITQSIESLILKGHVNLVETLAENIAQIALGYVDIHQICVKVEKLDAIKNCSSVGVEITRQQKRPA